MLSELLDWRGVFGIAAAATALLAVGLLVLLPAVPAENAARISVLIETLRRPGISLGMVGHVLVIFGHALAYTYIRLALERVQSDGVPVDESTIILLLAVFGIGGFIGNLVIGVGIDRTYRVLAVLAPSLIAAALLAIVLGAGSLWTVGVVTFVWGFFFASWLLIVNTWVGHRMPDRLEAGGGLVVVGFQAAIMLAAGVGGMLVDAIGIGLAYTIGAVVLVVGAVLFGLSGRRAR
jgi:predicted MFS family arabinose efflux permease